MRLAPAASIAASPIRDIADLADRHPGTLRLFFGEDTLPTPEFLKHAGQRAIAEDHTFYTPNAGYPWLREAIAGQAKELHGVTVDPAREIVVTASGMVALAVACHALVGPGDSALVLTPLWPNVQAAVRMTGARAIEVPLGRRADHHFALDLERLEAAIRPDTRLLALASPNNPTGWTATDREWTELVDFCASHDLWLLADGVYDRIVYDGRVAPSPLAIDRARPRTIIAHSFSKAYRMTGWRIGYAIAPEPVARAMTKLQEFVVSHAPGFCQQAAWAAIRDGEAFLRDALQRYARHRQLAVERLRAIPGVALAEPPGAFYAFPQLDGLSDSQALCEFLVARHGVGLAPGSAFGPGGEGHVRICFAVEESVLLAALDRFEAGWIEFRG